MNLRGTARGTGIRYAKRAVLPNHARYKNGKRVLSRFPPGKAGSQTGCPHCQLAVPDKEPAPRSQVPRNLPKPIRAGSVQSQSEASLNPRNQCLKKMAVNETAAVQASPEPVLEEPVLTSAPDCSGVAHGFCGDAFAEVIVAESKWIDSANKFKLAVMDVRSVPQI